MYNSYGMQTLTASIASPIILWICMLAAYAVWQSTVCVGIPEGVNNPVAMAISVAVITLLVSWS